MAARARAAREAADVDTLASDPYLAELVDRLHAVISDLADTRWSSRGPAVLAAAARAVAREQARLDAALLRLVGDVDTRADIIPRAKPHTAAAAFLRTALGLDSRPAAREAGTARLVTGESADLAAVGAAYAAGQISRAHLDIAVGLHHRLGPTARATLMPVTDPDTGEVTQQPTITAVDAALARYARAFSVPELARIADRLVQTLNPPSPGRRPPAPLPAPVPPGGRIPVREVLLRPRPSPPPHRHHHRPGRPPTRQRRRRRRRHHRPARPPHRPPTPPRRPLRSHRSPPLHPPPQHHPAPPTPPCQPDGADSGDRRHQRAGSPAVVEDGDGSNATDSVWAEHAVQCRKQATATWPDPEITVR